MVAQLVKNPPAVCETWIQSLGWKDALEKGQLPTPVFWPRKFHGQGESGRLQSMSHKESDKSKQLSLHLRTEAELVLLSSDSDVEL